MTQYMTDKQLSELEQMVTDYNEFCSTYGDTHGSEAYGEAGDRFHDALTDMFPDDAEPSVTAIGTLIAALRHERAVHQATRELCSRSHMVIDAYAAYHAHVDGIECPLCSVGKDGACQIANDLDLAIENANYAYDAARDEQEES